MNCPRCKNELRPVSVKNVTIDVCDSCEGVWFDADELSVIIESSYEEINKSSVSKSLIADKNTAPGSNISEISCPRCNISMQNYTYSYDSSVKLDRCPSCYGIWVDDGEIKGIIDYINKTNAPLSPEQLELIQAKLNEVENNFDKIEEESIDDMVESDDKSGVIKSPGKALQSIYKFFYKIGL